MATIITKNSSTASSVPLNTQLVQGELAVNVTDKRLFTENASGTVVELGTNPSSLTLPNGTANGVPYLNGSKVLTTGSALTFDGTNFGIGGAASMYWSGANKGLAIAGSTNGAEIDLKISGGTSTSVLLQDVASNLRLGNSGNFPIIFHISDTEQMRLTSTGLGIGTSSPVTRLEVRNDTSNAARLRVTSSATTAGQYRGYEFGNGSVFKGGLLQDQSTDMISIFTPIGGQSLNLTTEGNLGLGVTPSAWNADYKNFAVATGGQFYGRVSSTEVGYGSNYYRNSGGSYIYLTSAAASYQAQVGGVHYWFAAPSGTAGNAISFTQAMTLDASGNLLVGTTSLNAGERLCVVNSGAGKNTAFFHFNSVDDRAILTMKHAGSSGGTSRAHIRFENDVGTQVGNITVSGSATAYNTSSDYRLKEDIQPMTGALAKVSALKPVTYTWKADGSDGEGFIAHELAEVVPQCVTGEKDAVDENGNPKYQGIDTSFLVATLTAAIQELKASLDEVKLEFDAYKAAHP